ncbi:MULTISPECIES: Arc family DNA-binding protein [unclassified Aureimonas]|uniref:Arc family DNA-binding protein n=1 Tax=unclassified Aureimonas TaxID=2615206 RepID=UPI000700F194|nr:MULTISPECIES: Arc family DNA-binding protein [unclassified Aureimonas]KQT57489.1 hypothetical protein ASG62_09225 [Aureimonas sp. Leaf427]KQT77169.1 hypothetical protein ASG54_13095 [Aureimonas sp. Leaf460]
MTDDKKYPSQAAERFQVRMPDGLRDRLRDAAEINGRAMNTEIVKRLEESFEEHPAVQKLEDEGWKSLERLLSLDDSFSEVKEQNRTLAQLVKNSTAMLEMLARHLVKNDAGANDLLAEIKQFADRADSIAAPELVAPDVPPLPPGHNERTEKKL